MSVSTLEFIISVLPYYYDYRDNSLCELLKPHLTIYLDAPVNVLQQRIKERGDVSHVPYIIIILYINTCLFIILFILYYKYMCQEYCSKGFDFLYENSVKFIITRVIPKGPFTFCFHVTMVRE